MACWRFDGLLKIWFTPQSIADNTAAVRYVRSALRRLPTGEGYALACEALAAADLRPARRQDHRADADRMRRRRHPELPRGGALAHRGTIHGAQLEWIAKARHASVIERPDHALALLRNFLLAKS